MNKVLSSLKFPFGQEIKNRFLLAPLTNCQSDDDGKLSEEEFKWLTMRSKGGFGLTMTCASHIQKIGRAFPGQMGIFSDDHVNNLKRLTDEIRSNKSISIIQLHHAGMKSPKKLIGETPVCPSDNESYNARALSISEVKILRDDFIKAAVRSKKAGFDGVELHGAHAYIICQFLSSKYNLRDDIYGGNSENRFRLVFEIIDGIRAECGNAFIIGVRLSPEGLENGINLKESKELAEKLMISGKIDFLDMSLWDVFKEPEEDQFKGKNLIEHFSELNRGETKLGVAGKIKTTEDILKAIEYVDWLMLGRAAILHHNFPILFKKYPNFKTIDTPVDHKYLIKEGLSKAFIDYLSSGKFDGMVKNNY
jgi:2,4-dienoyl-CoA reductase-like NADH-dependent reductase (Old Yellow Enzyme family)